MYNEAESLVRKMDITELETLPVSNSQLEDADRCPSLCMFVVETNLISKKKIIYINRLRGLNIGKLCKPQPKQFSYIKLEFG